MRVTLFISLLILSLVACRPSGAKSSSSDGAEATQLRVELTQDPAMGALPLNIYVLDEGTGVSGAEIEVTGDMTHAGMVPVIVTASEVEPGLYSASEFEFTMAGDWIITTEVKLPDGTNLMTETKVAVPGQ